MLTLVERGGSARSFHVDSTSIADIVPVVKTNVARESAMMTDTAPQYRTMGHFASHDMINHTRDEYSLYEGVKIISTNTVEGFYSIFKRGVKGVYQHCSEKHLHRYLAEFDFRYNNRSKLGINIAQRASHALNGISGKWLTYRQ